jgi:hypothetical protein
MKNYYIVLLSFVLIQATVFAQKDSLKKPMVTSATTTTKKITVEQEQWIRKNYQKIAVLKKDSARMEIRKNFPSVSDPSADYIIGRAAKLVQQDKQKHLAMVQQMLRTLSTQKTALSKKIVEKENELKKTKDKDKIKSLTNEIAEMKNKMKDLDKEIRYLRESK